MIQYFPAGLVCIKEVLYSDRHYTGPIVFYADMNAYLNILFIYNSDLALIMKIFNGWQSFEDGCSNV